MLPIDKTHGRDDMPFDGLKGLFGTQDKEPVADDFGSSVYLTGMAAPQGIGQAGVVIRMAEDFSPEPAGVCANDGEASAERFREEFLTRALKNTDSPVVIVLNGLHYAPSAAFVEAAFGGLVTVDGHSKAELRERLAFSNTDALDNETRALALHYIDGAAVA